MTQSPSIWRPRAGRARIFEIVQFGTGGVGRNLIDLITTNAARLRTEIGLDLRYRAIVGSRSVLHVSPEQAASDDHIQHIATDLMAGETLTDIPGSIAKPSNAAVLASELDRLRRETGAVGGLIVADVSGASDDEMTPLLITALKSGARAVLANKRPLCGAWADWQTLVENAGAGYARLRYETTVGAALPVIAPLHDLLDSGDTIVGIEGTFSGTLAYIMNQMEGGERFSLAVRAAREAGYTEPDPRDDLGGVDVARKALIVARTLGWPLNLSDVSIESLYPDHLAYDKVSPLEFMARIDEVDAEFGTRMDEAQARGNTLRYIATVRDGKAQVGLQEVARDSVFGRLGGTDNIIAISSHRYAAAPLVIQGAGAGQRLTAGGVLSDIINFGRY